MAKNKTRIIFDTNWYISATINKNSRRILYKILTNPNLIILFSDEIVKEYKIVIERTKFSKIIRPGQALRFIRLVTPKLEYIGLNTSIKQSRDPKDDHLLSLSIDGDADYLITGDIDLLILEQINQTKIIRLNDFLALISNRH